tara:strand:+ start:196 stop:471 length:276 start_codon:yes stop_codon:yes gene_type:complete
MEEYNTETKVKILKSMWAQSKVALFFEIHNINPPDFCEDSAFKTLNRADYIDYFCGRLIKTNFKNLHKTGVFNRFNNENNVNYNLDCLNVL